MTVAEICPNSKIPIELRPRLPNLKVVSNYGVGVDHIDVEAAHRLKIPVGNTPHVLNGATADQAMALLLAAGGVVQLSHFVH